MGRKRRGRRGDFDDGCCFGRWSWERGKRTRKKEEERGYRGQHEQGHRRLSVRGYSTKTTLKKIKHKKQKANSEQTTMRRRKREGPGGC